jgi:hypothetical protein
VFESARTRGYISDEELSLTAGGFGVPIGTGNVGPLCGSDFVEKKPNGRIVEIIPLG